MIQTSKSSATSTKTQNSLTNKPTTTMTALLYSVYILPKERYCGATKNLVQRIRQHSNAGKNIKGYRVIAEFYNKREALNFEKKYQLRYKYNGYIYTEDWRDLQAEKLYKNGDKNIYSKRRRKVICITTGEIFEGVNSCERKFNISKGNLSRLLNGEKYRLTIHNLKFAYYGNRNSASNRNYPKGKRR